MTDLRKPPAPCALNLRLDGNDGAPRVLVFTEHLNATFVISFEIPMREMYARGEVNLAAVDNKSVILGERLVTSNGLRHCWELWTEDFKPDVVVFSRYGLPFAEELAAYFKGRNIPIVYHIDDNLMDLPKSLGEDVLKRQGDQAVIDARIGLMANAELIYASTTHLAKLLEQRFAGKEVVHGMYASYVDAKLATRSPARDHAVIGYMGSRGHQEDLALAVPDLVRLLTDRPTLRFEVYGTIKLPQELEQFGERVRSVGVTKSYRDFLLNLASLGWDIGLAPLVNEPFNLCKAPTKFIEYTSCSIPVAASNVPVYAEAIPAGCGELVDRDWYAALSRMLDSPEYRQSCLELARQHCSRVFSPARLQTQLYGVIRHAMALRTKTRTTTA